MITVSRAGEVKLVETLGELTDQLESWTVINFRLSKLLEEYRTEYQLKIAVNLAADLLQALQGGIYMCSNGDMAVLARNLMPQLLNKLIFQLRYLYMDDPLAYTPEGDDNVEFCTVYPLETMYRQCVQLFNKSMVIGIKQMRDGVKADAAPQNSVLDASGLSAIEKQMASLDLSNAVRRQAICTFNGPVRRIFDEMYIHIPHLRELLKTGVDFLSNKWLFKYITQLLDQRVLAMIAANPATHLATPLSLNLNVETLLSDGLNMLDMTLTPSQKVSLMFEVPVVDAFADSTAFTFARTAAHKLGYRVCLDGLSEMSFRQINRNVLGVDLVKLQWNADLNQDRKTAHALLKQAVDNCGGSRIILCRCDSEEAILYGQDMGISLFQGRFVDSVLDPSHDSKN
jgi:hypothetical protein